MYKAGLRFFLSKFLRENKSPNSVFIKNKERIARVFLLRDL